MKTVVICGSRKFRQEIIDFIAQLKADGVVVYAPHFESDFKDWDKLSKDYQHFTIMGLAHDHIQKIRMADVVFIYNKDGYSGVSVSLEIGCAVALSKPVYALAHDEEICRETLFTEVVSSAEEFAKRLV
jgi:nucleoside 2-deoxyribosyltransferase